ncbi:MAG TPA: NADP-dependent oxidoreductase, partial [Rhodospirillales bacterium]|nr:NADP-dependent oxidoreductase [Rhodospirillales bacterium]
MRVMVIDGFGGAERLHPAELPAPVPAAGEVLIRIVCAGVNPVDWKIREGWLQSLFPHQFPLIPGWDAAGTIAAVGDGVEGFAIGDRVWAYCRKPEVQWGTYAEYVTMPADAVAPMPGSLDFEEAAAIPLVGLTSWQALFDAAGLAAGQSVLIHAGAGGIGS